MYCLSILAYALLLVVVFVIVLAAAWGDDQSWLMDLLGRLMLGLAWPGLLLEPLQLPAPLQIVLVPVIGATALDAAVLAVIFFWRSFRPSRIAQ